MTEVEAAASPLLSLLHSPRLLAHLPLGLLGRRWLLGAELPPLEAEYAGRGAEVTFSDDGSSGGGGGGGGADGDCDAAALDSSTALVPGAVPALLTAAGRLDVAVPAGAVGGGGLTAAQWFRVAAH
eukprot:SAG11_NODE_1858_length_4159_cov_22.716256_6_plen_125_part_01